MSTRLVYVLDLGIFIIFTLFIGPATITEYTTFTEWVNDEYVTGNKLERTGCGVTEVNIEACVHRH
jgi:hypothetical protein